MKAKVALIALSISVDLAAAQTYPHYSDAGITVAPNAQEKQSRFSVFGDFIYWRTDVEGTEVAEKGSQSGLTPAVANLETVDPKGEWRAGFRAGIGGKFGECAASQLMLTWTYLNAVSVHLKKITKQPTDVIFPLGPDILGPQATSVRAHWQLKTNILDLEWGRTYSPTKGFSIIPHGGMRGALFHFDKHQNYNSVWTFYPDVDSPSFQLGGATSGFSKFNYAGGGIRAATDLCWKLSDAWSVVGNLGLSLLYGRYDIHQHYKGFAVTSLAQPALIIPADLRLKKDMWRMRSNLDAFLGVKIDKTFGCDDQYDFSISVGYEMTQWFQLNEIPQTEIVGNNQTPTVGIITIPAYNYYTSQTQNHGNISSQGMTVKVVVDF